MYIAITFAIMNRPKHLFLLFVLTLGTTVGLLGWSGYQMMQLERHALEEQADRIMKGVAVKLQYANFTASSIANGYNKKDIAERIAFAAGITQNQGKIGMYFDDDTLEEKEQVRAATKIVPVLHMKDIAGQFGQQRLLVKTVVDYKLALQDSLGKSNIGIHYILYRQSRTKHSISQKTAVTSSPLIINVLDPVVYYIDYTVLPGTILDKMKSYVIVCVLILAMVCAAFIFYIRSYKVQMQMVQFREALFSNITHELKTPLSSLQLIVESVGKEVVNEHAMISKNYVDFAGSELKRMKLLVDKILSFGKMNMDQFELNKTYVQLDKIVEESLSIMQLSMNAAQIDFRKQNGFTLLCDEVLLTNMLTSLLDNALKYNTQIPKIVIELTLRNTQAVISISDNGIGIPGIYHKKIFEPFFRVPTGDAHDVKGHGLGLSFAAQVVKLHGGAIGVDSNEQGTTFTITIPNARS